MFVSEIVIEKKSLNLVQQKINLAILYFALFSISILASLGITVFGVISKVVDYNVYLFAGIGILISVFYFVVIARDYKINLTAKKQILEYGFYSYKNPLEINPKRKLNGVTIFSIICAILIVACLIAVIVMQVLKFNVETIYIVPIMFVLAVLSTYQMSMYLINDKLYRNAIFEE